MKAVSNRIEITLYKTFQKKVLAQIILLSLTKLQNIQTPVHTKHHKIKSLCAVNIYEKKQFVWFGHLNQLDENRWLKKNLTSISTYKAKNRTALKNI